MDKFITIVNPTAIAKAEQFGVSLDGWKSSTEFNKALKLAQKNKRAELINILAGEGATKENILAYRDHSMAEIEALVAKLHDNKEQKKNIDEKVAKNREMVKKLQAENRELLGKRKGICQNDRELRLEKQVRAADASNWRAIATALGKLSK